jgi:predicted AAA+ superfamily ATPase
MQYNRTISQRLTALSEHFPALVLTGARQVGKTTLLKTLFPTHNYVSLDLIPEAELAEHSPEEFLKRHPDPLIVDEVQYAPGIFRHLKAVIDQNREQKGRFILTGSQKFTLMKEVSDSLAGRCAIVELEGLSAEECQHPLGELVAQDGATAVLTRGSFPELWQDLSMPEADFYRSYLGTYIERDVRQILNVTSLRDFDRFIRVCASYNGQELNKSVIASAVGIAQKTVNDWLSVLCSSNQISLLEPYFANLKKRIVKSPRLYFNDTGMLCFLLGLTKESVGMSPNIGSIWEAYLYGEIRKYRESHEITLQPWFFRDSHGLEVDFLLQRKGLIQMIEAKWTELPVQKATKSIEALQTLIFPTLTPHMVACRCSQSFPLNQSTNAVNGFRLYEELKGLH